MPYMSVREWGLLVLLSILWGGSFFFVETLVDDLPPLTIASLRVGLAAPPLWILIVLTGQRIPGSAVIWGDLLMMGFINNVIPFSLIVWGQAQIASGVASILNATTPMFAVLVAGILLHDERMTRSKLVGIAVGMAGVAVMVGPETLVGAENRVLAQLAVLGAAISYAFAAVFGRRFRGLGVEPVVVAAGQVTMSALLLAPLAIVFEQPFTVSMPGLSAWAAIAGLAVLSTSLAYIIYFRLLATVGATNLMLVTLMVPVVAILLGVILLAERLAFQHIVGMSLIGAGLVAIDGRLCKRHR